MANRTKNEIQIGDMPDRADRALANHPLVQSRSRAARLIETGLVERADGRPVKKPSEKLMAHSVLFFYLPEEKRQSEIASYDIDLEFPYEDEDILVVNKPAGLVVHPAAGHQADTLVNAIIGKVQGLSMGFGEKRPGIVHRLDKDTSGLLVVAKNDFSQQSLVSQFKARSVQRLYHAMVYARPQEPSGTIESSLIRHPVDRKRFTSERHTTKENHNGRWAITHYQLINSYTSGLSLVQCQLETGRTHQIRVHLSELGHPLIGDRIYGSDKRLKNLKSTRLQGMIRKLDRIGLHAKTLGFAHPRTNEKLMFDTKWPEDMGSILSFLRPESIRVD